MGKIGNGNIRIVETKDGLRPTDEVSAHLIIHCWDGSIPIPHRQREEFLTRARARGNFVLIQPQRESTWATFLSLLRGRRETSGGPS